MNITWARADSAAATAEGWDVFDVDSSGRLEIERIDDPRDSEDNALEPRFSSDTEALIYIESRAAEGSSLHLRALAQHTPRA